MNNPSYAARRGVLWPLIRAQLQPLRGVHSAFLVVWLSGLWVLQLIDHPGWLIAMGAVYVVCVIPTLAGRDVIDGTEEFSFSLPPGRGTLFRARLLTGLGFLGLLTGVGTLAVAYDLPQAFWSLFASSGVTEPNEPVDLSFLYPLAVLAPLCAFAVTFAIASLAGSRGMVAVSWLAGLIVAGLLTALGLALERLIWDEPIGWLLCPALLLATVLILIVSSRAYANKEAVTGGGRVSGGRRTGAVLVVLLVLGALLFVLAFLIYVKRVESRDEEVRAHQQMLREQSASEAANEALRDTAATVPAAVPKDANPPALSADEPMDPKTQN